MADFKLSKYATGVNNLWFAQKKEEAWGSVRNLIEEGDDANIWRRNNAKYAASVLESLGLSGFAGWAYGSNANRTVNLAGPGKTANPLIWNYGAAGMDVLQAKVVGKSEPKVMLQVTNGSWDDHRTAIWTGRLLETLYRDRQGIYNDVWDLARSGFKIAGGVSGSVAAKVVGYGRENKLVVELHDTLDMVIDHFDAPYSNPTTYGEITWMDPHRLMAAFPEQAQMIWDSKEDLPHERGGHEKNSRQMVKLYECWRVKQGPADMGRYIATLKNGVLIDRDYDFESPPFAFFHCRRSLAGFWGIPLLQRGLPIIERINKIIATLDKAERLTPRVQAIVDTNGFSKTQSRNIKDVMLLFYNSKSGGKTPQINTPPIYDQTVMNLLKAHIDAFYEIMGINSMQMQSQKPAGVTAAVAIRAVADIFSELFSVVSRDWTNWVTRDIGNLHIRAINDMAESGDLLEKEWDGGTFTRTVKSDVVPSKDKKFTIGAYPVSGTRNTPADRLQMADEMLSRQALSEEGYERITQSGDLQRELDENTPQYRMIAKAMDSWLYDEIDEVTNISPLPWMNLESAIAQVLDGYIEALMTDNFDTDRETYFRRYITMCDKQLQKRMADKARMEAAARGSETAVKQLPTGAPGGESPQGPPQAG